MIYDNFLKKEAKVETVFFVECYQNVYLKICNIILYFQKVTICCSSELLGGLDTGHFQVFIISLLGEIATFVSNRAHSLHCTLNYKNLETILADRSYVTVSTFDKELGNFVFII